MKVNILDVPVFYINLKDDLEKSKKVESSLKAAGFKRVKRFNAYKGLSKKEGCARSHQQLLDDLDIEGPFLVLEDDVEISRNFDPVVEFPDDADAVYLGLSSFAMNNGVTDKKIQASLVGNDTYRIYNMLAAHAILYLKKDYYKFLANAIKSMIAMDRNQDNARAETMKYFNIYAPSTPLFYQEGRHERATKINMRSLALKDPVVKTSGLKFDRSPKITVVVLTWKRLKPVAELIKSLSNQTYRDFSVYISNGNPELQAQINKLAMLARQQHGLEVTVKMDGNERRSFRRLLVAKQLAKQGTEIIFYIDDDVSIPNNYIEKYLMQYEPKTYHSGFAWTLFDQGRNYYKSRKRRNDNDYRLYYCGTAVSMIDASIFLEDGLTNPELVPAGAYKIEDLWLSYYADHVMGWKLKYINAPGTIIGGGDSVALYREVAKDEYTKSDFLKDLVSMGWKIPEKEIKIYTSRSGAHPVDTDDQNWEGELVGQAQNRGKGRIRGPSDGPKKVVVHSRKNASWAGVGRVYRGHNIVTEDQALRWLQKSFIRASEEDEVLQEFGRLYGSLDSNGLGKNNT